MPAAVRPQTPLDLISTDLSAARGRGARFLPFETLGVCGFGAAWTPSSYLPGCSLSTSFARSFLSPQPQNNRAPPPARVRPHFSSVQTRPLGDLNLSGGFK